MFIGRYNNNSDCNFGELIRDIFNQAVLLLNFNLSIFVCTFECKSVSPVHKKSVKDGRGYIFVDSIGNCLFNGCSSNPDGYIRCHTSKMVGKARFFVEHLQELLKIVS